MATIDKDVFDKLMHNSIDVSRYGEQQARDIVALLNRASKDILSQINESDSWSQRRLAALFKEINLTIADTYTEAADTLKTELTAFAAHASDLTTGLIATSMPVTWNPVAVSLDQLAAIISKVPIRIGKDSSLLFDEAFKTLAGGLEEKVRGSIRLGMIEGESTHQIANRVGAVIDGPRRQIYNLTHTCVQHTSNQAAALTMQANSDIVRGFLAVATLDSKTCLYCVSRSNREYKLTDPGPTWHIGCRCARVPITRTFKELGIDMPEFKPGMRSSTSGPVPADISFDQFLRGRPVKDQIKMLGPTRQKLFAAGMKIDKFTDNSGITYTLDQLKSRNNR